MRTHVVGGGLAGLAAALTLADAGLAVTLHEAGPACGGRCRSYHDRALGCRIDNGNHLLLSGNREVFRYLRRLGTEGTMAGPGRPEFHFFDAGTGERWRLLLSPGRLPWWLFLPRTRVPGTRLGDYASLLRLARAPAAATVRDAVGRGALADRLLDPLAIAILNTMPERGSAALLGAVFRDSLARGGAACVPCFPAEGLSETFVDPAVAALAARGATVRLASRISALGVEGGRVASLAGPDGAIPIGHEDAVVLAVPAPVASALLPELPVPDRFEAILNIHFRTDAVPRAPAIRRAGSVGLTGGAFSEWVFAKPGVVSVTVSAANRHEALGTEEIATRAWAEAVAALGLPRSVAEMPPFRVVREKRATFEATPEAGTRRPGVRNGPPNVALAGDWTATGLPATIEGAIKSGRTAAEAVLERAFRRADKGGGAS